MADPFEEDAGDIPDVPDEVVFPPGYNDRVRLMFGCQVFEISEIADFEEILQKALSREAKQMASSLRHEWDAIKKTMPEALLTRDFVRDLQARFPQVLKQSLFTACMSIAESQLNVVAESLGAVLGIQLRPCELRGADIERSLAYVTRVCKVDIGPRAQGTPWWHLSMLWKIRNAIVHNRGQPKKSDADAIAQYAKSSHAFSLDGGTVFLGNKCLNATRLQVDRCFATLQKGINQVLPKMG